MSENNLGEKKVDDGLVPDNAKPILGMKREAQSQIT